MSEEAQKSILRDKKRNHRQKKTAVSKWLQKRQIKRKYAQAAREAKKTEQYTQFAVERAGKVVREKMQQAMGNKSLLGIIAVLVLMIVMFSVGLTSCSALLAGLQSSYLSVSYLANESDICDADLHYTELETDLQMDISETESTHPGYDEYRYNVGEIGHNPYELMAYLSVKFGAFTYDEVEPEIDRIFHLQYTLSRTEIIETHFDADGNPYDWHVLKTTLSVKPLANIIAENLSLGEETERYAVYMQTYGNRQMFGNPFAFSWLSYVTDGYGYRVHPTTGAKDLHRGIDIAVAEGTQIHAIHSGRVISAGDAGTYGLCIVIEDENGCQSRYAHCSSLSVTTGQEVQRGDVIAAVGSTGRSTGPHLHLEIMRDGEYLNPYYFIENGDDGSGAIPGTPGGTSIPEYPGEAPTDATFAAMLAEAEKYLGYPYVWGGSSPSTSFDCSGFVCWVINHCGWNVGRVGAQALYNYCTPVSKENAKPGDLIFFTRTYSAPNPVSHVGIYVGNGQMIHCGDPISYANINSNYWQNHFYAFGRLP